MNELLKARIIAACEESLEAAGLRVEMVTDFSEVEDLANLANKPYLTPITSPAHNDLHERNAIWLVARSEGRPAIMGAARYDDLGQLSLGAFWSASLSRVYGKNGGPVIENIDDVFLSRMRGKVVYFGDLFVASGVRGSRKTLRCFTALGHMLVSIKWDPDWTYAFIREEDILRGAAANYGFPNVYPNPFTWIDPPAPRSNREWCAVLPKGGLESVGHAVLDSILGDD